MMLELPLISHRGEVLEEWIDANGHMGSMAYANLLHSSIWVLFHRIGIDLDYVQGRRLSVFQREVHLSYETELKVGARIEVRSWLVAHDACRIHHFHELINLDRGCRAATMEFLSSHVDLDSRRPTPFRSDVARRLGDLAAAYSGLILPAGHGARISLAGCED